jgi:hypothetical protein
METPDKILRLNIDSDYKVDVYLSCSWRPGAGQDVSWLLAKELDQAGIRALGDVPDFPEQDDNRIARIMQNCSGFLVVLPHRKNEPSTTSPYIVREIRVAAKLGIPIALFCEDRVSVETAQNGNDHEITFPQDPNEEKIVLENIEFFGPFAYDEGVTNLQSQVIGKVTHFVDHVSQNPIEIPPYAFLIARLQDDFSLARNAVNVAVNDGAGIPCLWSDDNKHNINIDGIRERTRLLIKHAEFIVADFTFGPENPENYNPSRSFELGIAMAYRRPILLFAQGPRRDPFFAAGDMQMLFWEDEQSLYDLVHTAIYNKRAEISRRVYNRELKERDSSYNPKYPLPTFEMNDKERFFAPNYFPLSTLESWFVAVGFALIALSLAMIAENIFGFSSAFDYAAVLAGIFTLVFASNLNMRIRQALGQFNFLRWLIPLAGLILLVIALVA